MSIIKNNDPYTQPSFSLSNRLHRLAWNVIWLFLFRPSPTIAHEWRSIILRIFGAKIGKNVHIYPNVKIWAPWNLKIANRVGIANNTTIYSMDIIEIGENSVISQGSHICAGSHDITSTNFQLITAPILIGKNVWLCADSFVGPGVTINDYCVLGARGVLTKSTTQPNIVLAGNPAKFIKMRVISK